MKIYPIALISIILFSLPVSAKNIKPCKLNNTLRGIVVETDRTMRACVTTPDFITSCGNKKLDVQEFRNNEKQLPPIKNPEQEIYVEGKIRKSDGSAGTWRLVDRFDIVGGKYKLSESYYTGDHYQTFCSM